MEHAVGSALFGMPSMDLSTNVGYLQQAQMQAAQNPTNAHAQPLVQYWTEVVQRQAAAQGAAPGQAPMPSGAPMGAAQAGPPVQTGPASVPLFH